MKDRYIIIVAGGKGLRMGTELPKQFLSLNDKPVLMHTIEAFYRADPQMQIVLVLPKDQQEYWNDLCLKYAFGICHQIIDGGETRFHSVKNSLKYIPENVLVGVHDGVRPLVSKQVIDSCFRTAEEKGAAFPVIPVTDTLRYVTRTTNTIVNRNEYFLVQTPQVFYSDILLKAYSQDYSDEFTDDVSVVEALTGLPVAMVEGEKTNLKITTPVDLIIAEALIKESTVDN